MSNFVLVQRLKFKTVNSYHHLIRPLLKFKLFLTNKLTINQLATRFHKVYWMIITYIKCILIIIEKYFVKHLKCICMKNNV